jgi:protein SCO1/2
VRTYAAPIAIPRAGKGDYLFSTRCAACHTIGRGDGLGPDLLNVTTLRERGWLTRYLAEPDRMLAEGDRLATALFAKYQSVRMPNLGLDSEEVAALLSHIEKQSRAALEQAHQIPASARQDHHGGARGSLTVNVVPSASVE